MAFQVEEGVVGTSDGPIHYRAAGSGPALVLLHATPRSSRMFLPALDLLASQPRVVAIDTPGYGDSFAPTIRPTVSDYSDWIWEAVSGLGLTDVVVGGVATGAYVAADLASRHAEVRRAVLVNCPHYLSFDVAQWRHAFLLSIYDLESDGMPLPRSLEDVIARDASHAPMRPDLEWLTTENEDLVKAGARFWDGIRAVDAFDLESALKGIEQEVLLLYGENFGHTAVASSKFRALLGNSRLVTIPRAGLFPMLDNPDGYAESLVEFVTE